MFVTMLVGIYDSNKNELCLSNAGHEPPLIYSKKKDFESFIISNPPLGVDEEINYKETVIPFKESSIYIFTDGITEIKNADGEMLGSEGLQTYIQKHNLNLINKRLKAIVDDIVQLEKIQKDDITMLVIDSI
jgi:sigma-B regulation protein RsbU (phosphoserine phosphatase)